LKSFKEHLNEQLLNEIGDTPAGREALKRYSARAENYLDKINARSFQLYDRGKAIGGERGKGLVKASEGLVRSKRYGNRIKGTAAAEARLRSAPGSEIVKLQQIYNRERGL